MFVRGFVSRARGGHSSSLVLFSQFNVVMVGSDHLCCFPCWLPVDQPYFALCPSMPSFPLFLREVLAGWTVPFFRSVRTWAGIMVVVTAKLHNAQGNLNGRCKCMCCIEIYLARGWILLHLFFPRYVVSNKFCSKDLEDPCAKPH